MKEDNLWDMFWDFIKKGGGVLLIVLGWLWCKSKKDPPRVPDYEYKSKLAEQYSVDVATMMSWVEEFLPEEYGERWKGTKVKKIDPAILKRGYSETCVIVLLNDNIIV